MMGSKGKRSASPPPPPPSSSDDPSYMTRLASKVQRQAMELLDMQSDLDERSAYVGLCEAWIVATDPSVLLPIDNEAVRAIQYDSNSTVITGSTPKKTHPRHTIASLTKQYDAVCRKLQDQTQYINELESKLEESDKKRGLAESRLGRVAELKHHQKHADRNAQQVATLREQLDAVRNDNKRLVECLENESNANEEQRVYLQVLQDALKSKAVDLGLDADMVAQYERDKAELTTCRLKIEKLKSSDALLKEQNSSLQDRIRLESLRQRECQDKLAMYEITLGQSKEEEEDSLRNTNIRLKKENNALVDYVRESIEPLKQQNQELEVSLESVSDALEKSRKDLLEAQHSSSDSHDELELMKLRLLEKDTHLNGAKEARDTVVFEKEEAIAKLRESEIVQNRAVHDFEVANQRISVLQAELDKWNLDKSQLTELQSELETTRNTLRCERREIVLVEKSRSELERELVLQSGLFESLKTQLEKSDIQKNQNAEQRNVATEELNKLNAKYSQIVESDGKLTSELNSLSTEVVGLRMLRANIQKIEKGIALNWAQGVDVSQSMQRLDLIMQHLSSFGSDKNDSVLNLLETSFPNLNSLLFSARTLVSQSQATEVRLKNEIDENETRFKVERKMLHDEIHALRKKLDEISQVQMDTNRHIDNYHELKEDFLKLQNVHQELINATRREPNQSKSYNWTSDVEGFAEAAFTDVRTRLDQQQDSSERVAKLRVDLEKAGVVMQEQEAMSKQLEDKLSESLDEIATLRYDVELTKRLCHSTLKGVVIRFRNSHVAIQRYFLEQERPSAAASLEQTVAPICELLDAVLLYDTTPEGGVRQKKKKQPRHRKLDKLNSSLDRAQRLVDQARLRLERRQEDSFSSSSSSSEQSVASYRRVVVAPRSPAKVRVSKNGSIQVSTFNDRDDGFTRRLEKTERIRSSRMSPATQRYKNQFREAQEKFRSLRSSSGF